MGASNRGVYRILLNLTPHQLIFNPQRDQLLPFPSLLPLPFFYHVAQVFSCSWVTSPAAVLDARAARHALLFPLMLARDVVISVVGGG